MDIMGIPELLILGLMLIPFCIIFWLVFRYVKAQDNQAESLRNAERLAEDRD